MWGHQVRPYGALVTADDRTPNTTHGASPADHDTAQHYEIRVRGHLGSRWAAWFDGLSLTDEADGTTVIRGPVTDQAALHGVLQKLRDVGLPLVSLVPLPTDPPEAPPRARRHPKGTSR
jgi:hypothetical protein